MTFLVDTNVLSELRRPRPDKGVLRWYSSVQPSDLFISVLVVGELRRGVDSLARRDPAGAEPIEQWLTQLTTRFRERLAPITLEIAEQWGALNVPDPLPAIDGLLGATALVHGWTVVTRNARDLERTGAPTLNPFSG